VKTDKSFVNKAILKILTTLYDSFPLPVMINPESFDPNAGALEQRIYSELIDWLRDEGFIRVGGTMIDGTCTQVVLTLKGFAVLNAVPESLKEGKTFGEYFKELLKEGSLNAINQAVGIFFSFLINK